LTTVPLSKRRKAINANDTKPVKLCGTTVRFQRNGS
jgi:hypothetical protein